MGSGTDHAENGKTVDRSPILRLLADDLTGSLDTAAHFASEAHPISIGWHDDFRRAEHSFTVIDTTSRDAAADVAANRFAQYLPLLEPSIDTITMLKLDSLLRGHPSAEIAACTRRWPNRAILVATALPDQNRVTRAGRQYWVQDGKAAPVGEDLRSALMHHGISATVLGPGGVPVRGICIFDAETDADLDRIANVQTSEPPLWCGTSGLAKAIARYRREGARSEPRQLPRPLLGVFGSDHPTLARQLDAVAQFAVAIGDDPIDPKRDIEERLLRDGVAIVSFPIVGASRNDAHAIVLKRCAALLPALTRPSSLLVSGGETLRTVCTVLGARSLFVDGQVASGIPTSVMRGGLWDGVRVASKSGAFGTPDLFTQLFASALAKDYRRSR